MQFNFATWFCCALTVASLQGQSEAKTLPRSDIDRTFRCCQYNQLTPRHHADSEKSPNILSYRPHIPQGNNLYNPKYKPEPPADGPSPYMLHLAAQKFREIASKEAEDDFGTKSSEEDSAERRTSQNFRSRRIPRTRAPKSYTPSAYSVVHQENHMPGGMQIAGPIDKFYPMDALEPFGPHSY